MISPLKPILTFFGVKDGKIEATALKRIADSLNNLINTYVAWADTVGQDYSISNFIKWLKNSQGEIVATELRMYALKAATLALNMVFAMFAGWVISAGMNAFINWMKNAKTHSEQLISTMEDAHDAAEEAQQDVDDIQQKLDDLDQKVKDLGAEKIEDIVDPQEKAKIQEINNLLETQLRLKKQIADDENNKANKAASDVFNDKSEVVVSNETPTSYAEADPNGIGVTVTPSKNVTRTEALREHTARVNELSDAYVKLMSDENATDEERAQAKKNLEDEISLTNDAGTKVSELADMYETDASKYGDVSSEVQECTDSMQGASDALERANNLLNGTTSVENTNLDAFKSKFKDVIEEIDNGYLSMQEAIAQYKDLSPLQAFGSMTGEAIINIDSDTAHQTEAEATALAKLHEIADANNISFEDLIGAFEQLGIVATSDTSGIANYATQLEETMKAIDSLQSSYKSCSSAVEEYNKYGYLSTDTMQSLLQMDTEYLNCLDLKDGKLQINKQRYAELLAAQYAQAEVEAIDQAITELNTIAKGDAAEKTQTLTTATEDEKNKLVALCPALEDATVGTGELAAALAAAQGAANGGNAEQIQAQIDAVMGALNTKITLLKKNTQAAISSGTSLGNQLNGFNEKTNKNNKSTAKSVTDVSSAFDTLNKAMKEYNQYGYLCADTAKSLVGLEDKFTACLTEQNGKLQINVEQFRKFVKEQLKEANAAKDGGKSADEMNKILNYLDQNVDTTTISFEQLTDAIKGYGTAMDEAKEKTDAIKSAFSDLYDVGTQKKDNDFGFLDMDAIEKQYQAVRNLYENTDLFTNPKYASALNSETGEVDYNSDAFKQMFADHLKELAESARETGGAAGEYLAQGFEDAAAKIANNVMSIRECIDGIGSSLNYATDRIDHFQSGFSDISDIVTQYNTYGGLSIDNYQKLMSLDDDYIKCLSLEGNQLKFNTEAYKELFIAKLNAMIDEYDAADETKALAQRLRELRDAVIASGDGFTSAEDKAKNFETTLGNIKSLLSDLIGVFEKFNENKSNDLKIQGDAWIDVIDKRIDALNEENDAQERAIELAKLQDEYERAKANKTVHVYGGRGQGFVWKADENAVREAGQNLSDKQREYKKKDEIDRLNKLKDKVQEANNLIGTSWDDYQKKLKYTAEFEAMTFEQMEGHYDGFKNSILDNMRDIQSVTNVSDAITNLEKLINTLKTLNDVITFFTSGGVSTDGGGIFGLFRNLKNMFTGESGDFDLGAGFKKMFDGAAKAVSDGWNWITGKNRKSFNDLISWNSAKLKIIGRDVSVGTRSIEGTSSNFFDRLLSATNGNLWDISGIFNSVSDAISGKTGNLFTDIIGFFTNGFSTANNVANGGLLNIVETVGSMFGPIAAGAQSIGSAISSGVVSFFPSIFAGLGTLVTSVGSAMAAMMQAIAAALSSIPIAGWIAAAAAVAGAVALIATIASIASNVSNTQVDEPTPAFQAKKYAKGTRGVKKSQIANVDEKGEELIVRNPDQGRMTYLEKGDGVIPAKETDNLMAIGADPEGWLAKGLAEVTGSAAAGAGMSAQGPSAQLSGAAAAAAAGVGSIFKSEYDEILGDTTEFMSGLSDIFKKSDNPIIAAVQSMIYMITKTTYRMSTVGKINSSKTVTESTSNTKKAAQSQISSMTSNFESSWKSVAGELGLDTKDIEATSKKMSEKMNELVNNTFDALNENTGLSAEQVEDVTNTMFDSLQKIYASGWNSLASTSGDMSEEIADKLNASYKFSVDSTNKAMNEISKAFGHSWSKVGGGVKTLSTNVQKTMEQAWADTSKDTQKLMYDMRACFDNSWSMNEAGVTHLADMTEQTIGGAYDEITSDAANTFGNGGSLSTETGNAWANVEPGAKDVNTNLTWMMDQSYEAIKAGCADAVTDIKNNLGTVGDSFEAVGKKVEETKQASANTNVNTTAAKQGISKGVTATVGATAGAAIGGAVLGPIGAVGGALIGGLFGSFFGHANGLKSAKFPHMANVDEQGPEMLVRKPDSGRYTYLETGDGVVPADITSRLFEMGGNPDAWFQKQMAKYGSQPIAQSGGGDVTTSIGDIIITNPVGSSDALANEIKQKLPTKVAQMQSKR